MTKTKGI